MKIACVMGTRPEAIKMAPILRELQKRDIGRTVLDTNQHPRQVGRILADLNARESAYENVAMCEGPDLSIRVGSMMEQLAGSPDFHSADVILAAGDTISVTAAAMTAFYSGIPFGHVEAGLRTWNMAEPYPEEMNRLLADSMATYYFCPTDRAAANLRTLYWRDVAVTGNTVIDSLDYMMKKLDLKITYDGPVLFTCHRRENWGEKMHSIFLTLKAWAARNQDIKIIYPVHMNPEIQDRAKAVFEGYANFELVPALSYPDMVRALAKCRFIITDSGGLQEEACRLRKRVVLLRDRTERAEALWMGAVLLAGCARSKIFAMCDRVAADPEGPEWAVEAYGDGKAAKRIVDYLVEREKTPKGKLNRR